MLDGMSTSDSPPVLFDWHRSDFALCWRAAAALPAPASVYQRIDAWQTTSFGRLYRLDGAAQASELDEFIYHEVLVHPAALSLPNLCRALIVGGGDGGSARQLLRYAGLQQLVQVELDPAVVELAQRQLPGIAGTAFADPRLQLQFGDGRVWVELAAERGEAFDLIVLDLTDPVANAAPLYRADFFRRCAKLLGADGLLSLHLGSPLLQAASVARVAAELRLVFPLLRPLHTAAPLYGGPWLQALAGTMTDPVRYGAAEIELRLQQTQLTGLRYYNGAMHQALLALPNYVQQLLAAD